MGHDKAWLDWEGRPLLEHVVTRISSRCAPVVVVRAQGQRLPQTSARELVDPPHHGDEGPLRGLSVGLAKLDPRPELVFLSGCDAPLITVAHVETLIGALPTDADAVAVRFNGHLQMLSSVVRLEPTRMATDALLRSGERSLQALFRTLGVHELDSHALPDPRALRTCNTPEDLAALRTLAGLDSSEPVI